VVHATGIPLVREDEAFAAALVRDLTSQYEREPGAWRVDSLPPGHLGKLLAAIVPFEMPIIKIEGKFKLGQNRSDADQKGVIAGLEHTGDREAMVLAEFMRRARGV